MKIIKKIADNRDKTSLAAKMRRKRFQHFLQLLDSIPGPVTILDIGGTQQFWEVMDFTNNDHVHVTLLNVHQVETKYHNFTSIVGDATNLVGIPDKSFDVVFSNSVIEHVGDYQQQQCMAHEVERVGLRYFVQTPNYYFPIEPHFLFPGFQWLPLSLRAYLLNHFNLGWIKKIPDLQEAKKFVAQIQLLKKKEFLSLFPEANLYEEKIAGLTKSFIVYSGW
jgi:2-polyprenyl-3-methyl-5-hydroxy-6-metoxy-1,4-benzoquinol methylase